MNNAQDLLIDYDSSYNYPSKKKLFTPYTPTDSHPTKSTEKSHFQESASHVNITPQQTTSPHQGNKSSALSSGLKRVEKSNLLDTLFLKRIIRKFNYSNSGINRINDIVREKECFQIIKYEVVETTFGPKNVVHITYENDEYRCWCTNDLNKLITDKPYNTLWNHSDFISFKMRHLGKIGQKFMFEIENVIRKSDDV